MTRVARLAPRATQYTVASRVTAVVIEGGAGSVDVTGTGQSAVSVNQRARSDLGSVSVSPG